MKADGEPARPWRFPPGLVAGAVVLLLGLASLTPGCRRDRRILPGTDAEAYVRIAATILRTGSLALPPPAGIDDEGRSSASRLATTPYALTTDGRLFPKHPWAFGLLFVPGLALLGVPGALATGVLLSSALAATVTTRSARVLGPQAALFATLLSFLGLPLARDVLWGISIDAAMALAMVLAAGLAADDRWGRSGLVAGLSLFLRPTMPVLLLPLPLLFFRRPTPHDGLRFLAGFAPPALVCGALNTVFWGAPWRTGYSRTAVLGASGFDVRDILEHFGGGFFVHLAEAWLPPYGLLVAAPVVAISLFGFAVPAARRPEWTSAWASAALLFSLLATYTSRSPRFAFPLLTASVPLFAAVLSKALEALRRGTGGAYS